MSTALFAIPLGVPSFQGWDDNGDPLNGGKLNTYIAGTSTPKATYPTYVDALAGTNANAQPVVLDAFGRAQIWVQPGLYKFILTNSASVTQTNGTADNVNLGGGYPTPYPSEWISESRTFVYVSATSFKISGADASGEYHVGRRVKTTNTGGTVYSTVRSVSYATDTTVTVVNDSGTLDAGLSAVWYGWLSFNNQSAFDPKTVVSVIKNGDQTAFTPVAKVTAWTEQIDSLGEFVTPTFTAKYPGQYLAIFQCEFSDSGTDVAVTPQIYVNGASVSQAAERSDDTANEIRCVTISWAGTLAINGTIEAYILGSANTTIKGTSGSRLTITRVS